MTDTAVSERHAREVAEGARQPQWLQPSFGKELFLGRLRLDLVHPYPAGSAEDRERGEAFLAKLREFCESRVDAAVIERDAQIPDEVILGLKEIGALGMKIDTDYGGLGLSQVYYNRALALVCSAHSALAALLSAHQSIGVPQPISMFGSEEQKRKWLPRCTNEISAFLLTEPDVGSDPARLRTTATPDGDDYVLDGVKLWTTNGVISDLMVVMAKVPRSEDHPGGITAFVVEADTPGIVVENRNTFMGLRGIENGLTRLTNVRVPGENRIGEEGDGLRIALSTLNVGRLSLPATCSGVAKWCLSIARQWSTERVQWGKPVGEHDAVAGKVAFIAATAYGLESMVELASELVDAGHTDIRIEAALAKLYGSEMSWLIADELVQIRGGRGFETAESLAARGERGVPAEQVLRDARINRIFEGSTEIMHLLIAREAVDMHLSVAGDIIDPDADLRRKARATAKAGLFYARWLPTLVAGKGQLPTSFGEFGSLATHLRYVERASRRLARSTFYAMSRWQGKLEYKQRFLGRIVDIGAELFAMTAACVRTQRDGVDASAVGLADAFCRQARVRADQRFDELWRNSDDTDRSLARDVLGGQYTWLEEGILDKSIEGPWISQDGGVEKVDVHRFIRAAARRDVA
ncbi:acyl-CoA dehydrogenase [Mycobacterium sp. JS623]|uniref:acyl-CoA dehydrogenase family protein n=1 Tax=Mycobacterium sp. JS623 TaxID=212767 RepID=UPI0002A59F70|nr:acyl-CoA dehydrogenase family protein [Mycobacterium sp. JS623]AGB21793.1 acyl-CoA dehydrogenase [Mycobacterium sp. JS623]